jgi:prevent-host-death family protein
MLVSSPITNVGRAGLRWRRRQPDRASLGIIRPRRLASTFRPHVVGRHLMILKSPISDGMLENCFGRLRRRGCSYAHLLFNQKESSRCRVAADAAEAVFCCNSRLLLRISTKLDKVASRGYLRAMREVGLKVLKNKLSEYVRLAAAGETVIITDRGRVVAEIVPPQPRTRNESFIERGVREGWLTPAKRPFAPLPPGKPVPGLTFEKLMEDLARDREDRW